MLGATTGVEYSAHLSLQVGLRQKRTLSGVRPRVGQACTDSLARLEHKPTLDLNALQNGNSSEYRAQRKYLAFILHDVCVRLPFCRPEYFLRKERQSQGNVREHGVDLQ